MKDSELKIFGVLVMLSATIDATQDKAFCRDRKALEYFEQAQDKLLEAQGLLVRAKQLEKNIG